MASFVNVCRFTAASSGAGNFVVSSAVTGYQTPAAAQAVDGVNYKYRAESADLSQWEVGYGVYTASGTTLARTVINSNSSGGTAPINFSAPPQVALVALAGDVNPIDGLLFGLTLSTAGASTTFTAAAGWAADSTALNILRLYASLAKTTGAWVVGGGNGSLDTGVIANSTWYHVWIIQRADTGVVDILTSLSATAPTLPANYLYLRRIGSMKTNGSGQWTKFIQDGDAFQWDIPVVDITATNPGTAAVSRTLSTPSGVRTLANIAVGFTTVANATDNPAGILISDLSVADTTPSSQQSNYGAYILATGASQGMSMVNIYTNTSSQVRSRVQISTAGTLLILTTFGWIDTRGRLA